MVFLKKFHGVLQRLNGLNQTTSQCRYNLRNFQIMLNSRQFSTLKNKEETKRPVCQKSAKLKIEPYKFLQNDIEDLYKEMKEIMVNTVPDKNIQKICTYYLERPDSWAILPRVTLMMARAINCGYGWQHITEQQRRMILCMELEIVASVMFDDLIDNAQMRQGIPSINNVWTKQEIMPAVNIMINTGMKMAVELGQMSRDVYVQIVNDQIIGEFMQTSLVIDNPHAFEFYMDYNYRKFTTVIANTSKVLAVFAGEDDESSRKAFQIAWNIGQAFQVLDDLVDVTSNMKSAGNTSFDKKSDDMSRGLATAPILYTCERYPEMRDLVRRRFKEPGDKEKMLEHVEKSQSIEHTKNLIQMFTNRAKYLLSTYAESPYQKSLSELCDTLTSSAK